MPTGNRGGGRPKARPDDARGGAREGTGPKGPRPPRLTREQTIAALKDELSRQPAIALVSTARAALTHLEAAREQEGELWRLRGVEERYNETIAAWNPLWDATRERGILIFQAMDQGDWSWEYGERSGRAPTPGEALLQALMSG